MKTFRIILFLVIAPLFAAHAQEAGFTDTLPEPETGDTIRMRPFIGKPGLLPYDSSKKISVRMEMGTSFGLGSGDKSLFGVYAAPHISYRVSPRFRVNFGAMIRNSNFINYINPFEPYYPGYTATFDDNLTQTFVYAEGEYLVSPRLVINTRVFKEVARFNEPQINPRALDLDSEGVSVGFNYRVSDGFQVGAQFEYSKGRRPYDPYNPFFPDSFGTFQSNPYGIPPMNAFDPWR